MSPLKVFTDLNASPELLERLREGIRPHELLLPRQVASSVLAEMPADPAMAEVDVAFGQPSVSGVRAAEKLRWLQVSSAGFTRYDTPEFRAEAKARGLAVTNSSSVYDQACAEHAFAFLFAQARMLPQALATRTPNGSPEWWAIRRGSRLLEGQSLLLVGYGAIGERLVELLAPFKMRITAMRRTPRGDEGIPVVPLEGLSAALVEADHVMNLLPDNAESRGFFGTERFAQMKRGAVFYNIGRGTTVDQLALNEALTGHLGAAWLDVTDPEPLPDDHPLWQRANCHITPHTAGGYQGETEALVDRFLENFERYLKGEALRNRVV
ncbi:MAG TPA: D-2-hydroxyacid dehydrogenase [Luteolibacter sp.]